ncbi:MAG: MMPL family transporter [Bacteroidota bacterium]|nr:MMPL family transporter [Bacteroidota bacterium]MDP3557291.1 MMPL family transporter [Bacteroidota bacterium]
MTLIKTQRTYNLLIIVFVLVFSLFCVYKIQNIKFDYDFEAFFPNEDHELEIYNNYRKTFEYDNEFALVAIENKSGIFNKNFLTKIDSLTKKLSGLKSVQRVTSPTNLKTLSFGGLVPTQTRVLHFENPDLYKDDSISIYQSAHLVGSFFPLNAKSLSIYIKTDDLLTKKQSDLLANGIETTLKEFKFDDIHYVGRIFAQTVYLKNLQKEFIVFICLSFIVIVIFLWFSFRSFYGVIVPVIIVLISILWTLGVMSLFGKSIDIMTAMLPTMIFIAGMSDVVHFFSKYFEEMAKGTLREKIYPLIIKEVGFPTFLTLITTVVGFLSLLFSSIKPIKEFGIYTSIGITIAFILTYTMLPALLYFFTPKKLVTVHGTNNRTYSLMRTGLFWIFRNQKTILIITSIVLILSLFGISKIKVNNILLEDLNEKVKIKQDFNFFDENYSGVRPFEILVTVKDKTKSVWDYDVITELNKVDEFIKKEYQAGFLVSPSSLVKSIYQNSYNDYKLSFPVTEEYETISKQLKSNKKNREVKRLITSDGQKTRISAKIRDMGSIKVNNHNIELLAFIEKNINTNLLQFEITGAAHLIDRNNEYMVSNMTQGFLFSLIVIGILTFFLHRSWRMVLVFIIPNIIPLIIIGGIMGFAGIELKAATSLVFSIAFGIATDDTIHFISRLKIELGYGKSLMYAFKRTYFETGKPIILTTFILLGGFMTLMISDFQSTFYFGFLICITVVIAVLADIFLLPVLLFLIYGRKKK